MSPDLSPIEHLWNVLKCQVEQRQHSNILELRDVVSTEWENIQASTWGNLVHSMPRRLAAVISTVWQNWSMDKYFYYLIINKLSQLCIPTETATKKSGRWAPFSILLKVFFSYE